MHFTDQTFALDSAGVKSQNPYTEKQSNRHINEQDATNPLCDHYNRHNNNNNNNNNSNNNNNNRTIALKRTEAKPVLRSLRLDKVLTNLHDLARILKLCM